MSNVCPIPRALLARVADGEPGAFAELVRRHGAVVEAVARRSGLFDARDVEDMAQETFLSVWRSASTFDPAHGDDVAFVAAIARRRAIDFRRGRSVPAGRLEEAREPCCTSSPERDADARTAMSWVWGMSDSRQREVLLSALSGFTHAEIAVDLDMPLGTVKSLYIRSIASLKRELRISSARPPRSATACGAATKAPRSVQVHDARPPMFG